ncbi:MAG: hypothetical protein J7513_06230 [Solirubrobacteraceae bacterium]|nr:hypothetical protein [Solirubrobacteraceae bacterium]
MLAPAVAAAALFVPSTAHAGALADTLAEATFGSLAKLGRADNSCIAPGTVSKAFSQWNDRADYVEAPGGSFEPGALGWDFSGSVSYASENEPFKVSGRRTDARSIVVGGGGSITSAAMCAGLQYPTLRFFAKSAGRGNASALITARYTGADGLLAAFPVGIVSAGSSWAPSTVSLTGSGIPLFTGKRLSFRIAPLYGSLQVDDVYVDPFRRT